jgi:hypothetical protein
LLSLLEKASRWKKELKLEKAGQRSMMKLAGKGDHFRFSSVFTYKNNQTEILKEKKPKPNRIGFQPTGFGSVFYVKNQKNIFFLTSKSQKIKPIFITSSPHDNVEFIPVFSQANGLPHNHKNTALLTITNP